VKRAWKHFCMLLKSTTFWTASGVATCETLKAVDPVWLAERPSVRAVLLPAIALLAVLVKIGQNQVLYLSGKESSQ
jgi:hypothetical protein